MHDWPLWMQKATDDSAMLPQVPSPDDIFVMVAGGSGKHSAVVPNCTFSRAVSRVIDPRGSGRHQQPERGQQEDGAGDPERAQRLAERDHPEEGGRQRLEQADDPGDRRRHAPPPDGEHVDGGAADSATASVSAPRHQTPSAAGLAGLL